MKLINKSTRKNTFSIRGTITYHEWFNEEYEFDKMSFGRDSDCYGLLLGYLIATHKNIELEYFSVHHASREIGNPEHFEWERSYSKQEFDYAFPDFDSFLQYHERIPVNEWGDWYIELYYKNVKINIYGAPAVFRVRICYDCDTPIDIIPLLEEIEKQTFLYHSFNPILIDHLTTEYQITFETAVNLLALLRNCFNSKYEKLIESFDKGILEFSASKEVTDRLYNLKFEDVEGLYDTLKETE